MLKTLLKMIMSPLLVLTLALGSVATTYEPAEARRRGLGVGIAAGIIGLGVLGAYAHGRDRHDNRYRSDYDDQECYKGPEECGWVNRRCFENSWGERVCRGGRWTCWRDTICE